MRRCAVCVASCITVHGKGDLYGLHQTARMWGQIFLLLPLLYAASAFNTNCPRECIPISQCPGLVLLLETHSLENIRTVQSATCSFRNRTPLVCCPEPATTSPPVTTPSTSRPINTDLLPKKCGNFANDFRIVGGTKTRLGHYPWMAALGYRSSPNADLQFLCGGSIINERYVLTAAHCLSDRVPEVIRLGEWDLTTQLDCEIIFNNIEICAPSPAVDLTFDEIISHPNYNTRAPHSDDIALIRLSSPVNFDANPWIQSVCLPQQGLDVRSTIGDRKPIVTGWGFTENGTTSTRLLQVSLPFIDRETCNRTYSGRMVNEQLCVGGDQGQDSCGGDSGGPLVISSSNGPPYQQIGIVSYGPSNCGRQGVPGVYTSVSEYKNWILENLKP